MLDLRCPKSFNAHAAELWRRVAPLLHEMGVLREVDLPNLEAMCLWYAEWKALQESSPPSAADQYKRTIAMASSFKNYATLAKKFGTTPADRNALKVVERLEIDPAAEFVA